jgi:hypothetical protein
LVVDESKKMNENEAFERLLLLYDKLYWNLFFFALPLYLFHRQLWCLYRDVVYHKKGCSPSNIHSEIHSLGHSGGSMAICDVYRRDAKIPTENYGSLQASSETDPCEDVHLQLSKSI